jgi:hypothetical protein
MADIGAITGDPAMLSARLSLLLLHPGRSAGPAGEGRIRRWLRCARDRRQLATLDDRLLADMGLSRDDLPRRPDSIRLRAGGDWP